MLALIYFPLERQRKRDVTKPVWSTTTGYQFFSPKAAPPLWITFLLFLFIHSYCQPSLSKYSQWRIETFIFSVRFVHVIEFNLKISLNPVYLHVCTCSHSPSTHTMLKGHYWWSFIFLCSCCISYPFSLEIPAEKIVFNRLQWCQKNLRKWGLRWT